MADNMKDILSVVATNASRLPDLAIKNGQLIFVKDNQKIALDFNGKRTFFNQIVTLQTEQERKDILAPISGLYYFVIENAVLWTFEQKWIQITTPPQDIVFIGTELPELGNNKSIYIDTNNHNISIWNNEEQKYCIVADKTEAITIGDILDLFI